MTYFLHLVILYIPSLLLLPGCAGRPDHPEAPTPEDRSNMFVTMDNRVLVPMLCNDSIPALFFFDTGAPNICDIMPAIAERLGVVWEWKPNTPQWRHAKMPVRLRTRDSMTFAYERIIPSEGGLANEQTPVDGLFGPNYPNKEQAIEINFEQERILLYPSDSVQYRATDLVLPYQTAKVSGETPIVEFPFEWVVQKDTVKFNYWFGLDTGMPFGLHFDGLPDELLKIQEIPHVTIPVKSPPFAKHHDVLDFFAQVHTSIQGQNDYIETLVNYRNLKPFVKSPAYDYPVGMVGVDFLKHFNVVIDPKLRKVILRRHARKFVTGTSSTSNLGFFVNRLTDKVGFILDGSAASSSGLQSGDSIVRFNRFRMTELSQSTRDSLVYLLPPNVPLDLEVIRNGKQLQIHTTTFDNPIH